MAISKRLRFEVLRRDNHTCRYCGQSAPGVTLTVDHVVPVALGGADDPSNLVAACTGCNSGKSSVPAGAPLVADVTKDAMRWAAAMRQAADERALDRARAQQLHDAFTEEWNAWKNWRGDPTPRPEAWAQSIDQFLKAGLTINDCIDLVKVAMESPAKDTWRYFCGCCWKRIEKLQERASEIVAQEDDPQPNTAPVQLKPVNTSWTIDDVVAHVTEYEKVATPLLAQDSIDSAHCRHMEWGQGACGDPVCEVQRAEALSWMADSVILRKYRDEAVMAEAEVLLDG